MTPSCCQAVLCGDARYGFVRAAKTNLIIRIQLDIARQKNDVVAKIERFS